MSTDAAKTVQVHPLYPSHCLHECINATVNQITDANSPVRDINEAHCYTLTESIRNYKYDYVRAMITVNVFTIVNQEVPHVRLCAQRRP